jgi:hypothetical protein
LPLKRLWVGLGVIADNNVINIGCAMGRQSQP